MLPSAVPTGLVAFASAVGLAGGMAGVVVTTVPAPASPPTTLAVVGSWVWPVEPPRVLREFEHVGRYEAGHRGVDLAASPGQPVVAVDGGTVTFAGSVAGREVVVVLHADGLRTTYEPLAPLVSSGDGVRAGQPLGTLSGPAHCATDCLHLGLRDGDRYLDPLGRLRAAAPVLLPLGRP
ncbi:M23 family metallopeptidase [Kineococcus sp. NBC_00420]|uniref:murein hydrolase activator EnvC family protein n=1 Tax=Kineococcus sp. NBC_00420 TaxID=2903564 RepID=UPI002E1A0ED9